MRPVQGRKFPTPELELASSLSDRRPTEVTRRGPDVEAEDLTRYAFQKHLAFHFAPRIRATRPGGTLDACGTSNILCALVCGDEDSHGKAPRGRAQCPPLGASKTHHSRQSAPPNPLHSGWRWWPSFSVGRHHVESTARTRVSHLDSRPSKFKISFCRFPLPSRHTLQTTRGACVKQVYALKLYAAMVAPRRQRLLAPASSWRSSATLTTM